MYPTKNQSFKVATFQKFKVSTIQSFKNCENCTHPKLQKYILGIYLSNPTFQIYWRTHPPKQKGQISALQMDCFKYPGVFKDK